MIIFVFTTHWALERSLHDYNGFIYNYVSDTDELFMSSIYVNLCQHCETVFHNIFISKLESRVVIILQQQFIIVFCIQNFSKPKRSKLFDVEIVFFFTLLTLTFLRQLLKKLFCSIYLILFTLSCSLKSICDVNTAWM